MQTKPENKFYILDFDRTLADIDKLLEVFMQIADQHAAISRAQIEAVDADMKRRGDSFDTAGYVRDYLMAQDRLGEWDQLVKQYIHESHSLDMLMPGASELIAYLERTEARYGILTYGNPLWQRLKLSAAGFNHVPHIITTTKEKGILIRSWQDDDGLFHLPLEFNGGTADAVVLIDDKAVSFDGFPDLPSRGFHVFDPANYLPAQQGSVPANVASIKSLHDVSQLL